MRRPPGATRVSTCGIRRSIICAALSRPVGMGASAGTARCRCAARRRSIAVASSRRPGSGSVAASRNGCSCGHRSASIWCFCSFPSIKDPRHDPGVDNKHTGEVITFVPWDAFSRWKGTKWKKRGSDYEAFKQALTEQLLDQYEEHYPDLIGMVDHAELSTPLSTTHFARSARGSIYGLEPTPGRLQDAALGPRTSVKGLYLGGVDVSTPGVTGGLIGGVLAATAAEPVRVARFLQPIMKRPAT